MCKGKNLFKNLEPVEDGSIIFMGNSSATKVKGKGVVELEFTSRKLLVLNDVDYVPEVKKNLVSIGLLNKFGFKLVCEANKFVLSKDGVFVGKGWANKIMSSEY